MAAARKSRAVAASPGRLWLPRRHSFGLTHSDGSESDSGCSTRAATSSVASTCSSRSSTPMCWRSSKASLVDRRSRPGSARPKSRTSCHGCRDDAQASVLMGPGLPRVGLATPRDESRPANSSRCSSASSRSSRSVSFAAELVEDSSPLEQRSISIHSIIAGVQRPVAGTSRAGLGPAPQALEPLRLAVRAAGPATGGPRPKPPAAPDSGKRPAVLIAMSEAGRQALASKAR